MEGTTNGTAPLPGQTPAEAADIAENKDLAALSYVWILSLVIYFSKHNSRFVRFHAKQGLVLFAFSLIFAMIPTLNTILLLIILALSVLGFLNAAQGLFKDLPIIGPIARADIPALKESWKGLWTSLKEFLHRKKKEHAASQAPASASAPTQPTPSSDPVPASVPPTLPVTEPVPAPPAPEPTPTSPTDLPPSPPLP